LRKTNQVAEEAVGRVKTVWVSNEGQAIVSDIIAHSTTEKNPLKLSFKGNVKITQPVQQHLQETILKHVSDILISLKLPQKSYTLSAKNLGAVVSSGIEISLAGYSSDLSVFLALLSSALNLPIRQDIVFTGHIDSIDGDILPVEKLSKKCEAAVVDTSISQFVYPKFESDVSLQKLKPNEYDSTIAALRRCRGKIKLVAVSNTLELLQMIIGSKAIVHAALKSGFFEFEEFDSNKQILKSIISYLTENNQDRFWNVLGENLLKKDINTSCELLKMYSIYFINREQYPSRCGERLYKLIISLPPQVKRYSRFRTLLDKRQYIKLIQFAQTNDEEDISLLHNALYGEIKNPDLQTTTKSKEQLSNEHRNTLDHLLEQLDPAFMESYVTNPYDIACAKYTFDTIAVKNNEEFVDGITAFYTHMFCHTNKIQGPIDKDHLGAEALYVLSETFRGEQGYKEALANAIDGRHGGLRYIFNEITDYLKEKAKKKHVLKTFKENIDPNDFPIRVNLIKEILHRSKDQLPQEIYSQPPEKYAENPEEIIQAFIKSKTVLETVLRRL